MKVEDSLCRERRPLELRSIVLNIGTAPPVSDSSPCSWIQFSHEYACPSPAEEDTGGTREEQPAETSKGTTLYHYAVRSLLTSASFGERPQGHGVWSCRHSR